MRIKTSAVKMIPKEHSDKFGVCVYGELSGEVKHWAWTHKFPVSKEGPYTNIEVTEAPHSVFDLSGGGRFDYMDGFSPNLNKSLHIGHASNLILAKAFLNLNIAKKTVAILGDTMAGTTAEALYDYMVYCKRFGYPVDNMYLASRMALSDASMLVPGEGDFDGTSVFDVDGSKIGSKIVGIKTDKTTSYFYQDVSLAQMLNAPTLYLTGSEQNGHFASLEKMFPNCNHIGLGLVKANGVKMSSRAGNVIMFDDVLSALESEFDNDALIYNVLAGFILKSTPTSDKNINFDMLSNPLNSPGLYLSYTLARLNSAGASPNNLYQEGTIDDWYFNDYHLSYLSIKSRDMLQPNLLFNGLLLHAKKISVLYDTHKIADNESNRLMFAEMATDLYTGMLMLGMNYVEKV